MSHEADDPLAERTLDSRLAFEGVFLRLYVDHVQSADGHKGTREYLRHPGAVMIVPLLDADHALSPQSITSVVRRASNGYLKFVKASIAKAKRTHESAMLTITFIDRSLSKPIDMRHAQC